MLPFLLLLKFLSGLSFDFHSRGDWIPGDIHARLAQAVNTAQSYLKESQMWNCLHQIVLWACLWDISWLLIEVGGYCLL